MIGEPAKSQSLSPDAPVERGRRELHDVPLHAENSFMRGMMVLIRRVSVFAVSVVLASFGLASAAYGHENQVIEYGSFLAGFTHPVLGLDHFLAMLSVGIVSALIGGRAIWTVPSTFVVMMAVGAGAGYTDIGIGSGAVELSIALSVILLGGVILLDRSLDVRLAMAFVAFFGFFHGYAHGQETPDIAEPVVYALGFLLGTVLIHLLGLLIGEVAIRYTYGRQVLRVFGGVFVVVGLLFVAGVM